MSVSRSSDRTMTADAFLAWSARQAKAERHELFDGLVVTMTAERAIHARTKYAVTRALADAISEKHLPCEALIDGLAVRVDHETVFEPDALVRCGDPLPDDAIVTSDPIIVVEVASPSTQRIDALLKLTRYFRNPSIAHYLIVMPDQRNVCHHRRTANEHIATTIHAAGRLQLDPPGLTLEVESLFP